MWAAWSQYRIEKRRRSAPPPEVTQHLLKLVNISSDASKEYKDHDWWSQCEGEEAVRELVSLVPVISNQQLIHYIEAADTWYLLASTTVAPADATVTSAAETVTKQRERAQYLRTSASKGLEIARSLH